ncbi:hypothetical protein ACF0H5_007472 [Mactra antiquata]
MAIDKLDENIHLFSDNWECPWTSWMEIFLCPQTIGNVHGQVRWKYSSVLRQVGMSMDKLVGSIPLSSDKWECPWTSWPMEFYTPAVILIMYSVCYKFVNSYC